MIDIPTDFECVIVSPDKILYEGKPSKVVVPGVHGELAILPVHTPIYAELLKGKITVVENDGEQEFEIEGGVVRVRTNSVTVVVGF